MLDGAVDNELGFERRDTISSGRAVCSPTGMEAQFMDATAQGRGTGRFARSLLASGGFAGPTGNSLCPAIKAVPAIPTPATRALMLG